MESTIFCIILWTQRRRAGANAAFLLASLVPGTLLLVQNLHQPARPELPRGRVPDSHRRTRLQQAVSDDELQRREESWERFDPAHPAQLPYPADLYIGFHDRYATPTLPVLYRNPGEGTSVLDLRPLHFQEHGPR